MEAPWYAVCADIYIIEIPCEKNPLFELEPSQWKGDDVLPVKLFEQFN